jgi:integrase/recombinase XerD
MRLKIDWNKISLPEKISNNTLDNFHEHLREQGLRETTIENYIGNVQRYIKSAGSDNPSSDDYSRFRAYLHSQNLSRSTLNQYGYAIKAYHEMLGNNVDFKRIAPNNHIPLYFSADEVDRIFASVHNLKHLAMLQVLFYGCLRATELCNLNDEDVNLQILTLRINNGKGGRDGIVYIKDECARILKDYLAVRPPLILERQQPLFYTDYGQRWRRVDLYHMFARYKAKAGINKRGGLHVFSRHTPATIMISKGCDLRIVQRLLRHKDIRTTLRYAHVSDTVARDWYNKSLKLES